VEAHGLGYRAPIPDLSGKRVLVTGASSGIGVAAAEAFARAGAVVALTARSPDGLEAAAARVRAYGGAAHVVVADLGERAQAERAVREAVEALGGLDVLVPNAAAMVFGRFAEAAPEDFERTMDVTFRGAVDVIRAALPHLERTGGAIVATGSIAAKIPLPGFSSYASAKHALRGFLGSLRVELLEQGSPVTVSMVHPGPVDTPLWGRLTSATGSLPRNPPDLYAPEEVARALVAAAARPRPEFTVGLEARLIDVLFQVAQPLADRVLVLVGKYYAGGKEPAPSPGGLWQPSGRGEAAGGHHGRPSLWSRLRGR
jgi:NAD(P)-dependent dehydrogenase (short-subunit alcohol dehydrogenase family)